MLSNHRWFVATYWTRQVSEPQIRPGERAPGIHFHLGELGKFHRPEGIWAKRQVSRKERQGIDFQVWWKVAELSRA